MNRDMWKIIRTAQVAVVALLLTVSCTKNPIDGGGAYDKEYVDFTIELQPPGGYTPAETRAMDDNQQNAITSALVIAYGANGGRYVKSEKVTVTNNKLTVKLETSQSESDMFDIVVIGNPPSDYDPYNNGGQYKSGLQESLTSPVTGKWTGTEFMMWGEQKNVLIKPNNSNFKIEMLRSLARIDVGAGVYDPSSDNWAGLSDFVLTEVRVVNIRDKFAVIPLPANVNTEGKMKVTAPSVPKDASVIGKTAGDALKYSGADIQNGTATGEGAYINSTIFVAEAPNTLDNGGRVTLIIGGTYNGTVSYYRMDLRVPKAVGDGYDYLPILRNYRYRVTITEISGAGALTPEQALATPPTNILTTLEPISEHENGGDILFDGNNYITTDVSEVQIYGTPDGVKAYDIFTVRAGTKAGATTTGTVTGPSVPPGSSTLLSGTSRIIRVLLPAGAGTHTYTVAIGTLQKTIKVTVNPPLDGFSTVLPFTEVASITVDGGYGWLTLSHNETYVQGEQKLGFIEGDAQGKAYVHLSMNRLGSGTTRTAKAMVTHNNSQGTTRVMLEQEQVKGEIVGYFGGDPTNTMSGESTMYPNCWFYHPLKLIKGIKGMT